MYLQATFDKIHERVHFVYFKIFDVYFTRIFVTAFFLDANTVIFIIQAE